MRKLLFLFFWLPLLVLAQTTPVDSLKFALRQAATDSARVKILCELSKQASLSDVQQAIAYARQAEQVATRAHDARGRAAALNQLGAGHVILGENDKAFTYYFAALKVAEQAGDTANMITTYNILGVLSQKIKDDKRALGYYHKAEALALQVQNLLALSKVYNNLGSMYSDQKAFAQALPYYEKSARLLEQFPERKVLAVVLQNIGNTLTALHQPQKALPFLNRALAIDQDLGNRMNETVTLAALSQAYQEQGDRNKALAYARQSFSVAQETRSGKKIVAAAKLLQDLYALQKNFEQAYKYQTVALEHMEKLDAEAQSKNASQIIARYESEKHELEDQKLKAEKERQDQSLRYQRGALLAGGVMLSLMMLLLSVSLFFRRRLIKAYKQLKGVHEQVQKQNREIRQHQEEILQQSAVLQTQNELLAKTSNFKSKIFSIVSHDLRSPFTTLKGILALTQVHNMSAEELQRILELLAKDVDTVEDMLNNLLVWSKSQLEEAVVHVQPLPLPQVLDETLEVVQYAAAQKQITLLNLVPEETVVLADRERMAFVLRNLLMNAIKFSFEGREVQVKAHVQDQLVTVSVIDFGKGIAAKHLHKLFSEDRFTTLGTSNEVGTGLGLMLCKELLDAMGGTITVTSEEGKGSIFSVTLPQAEAVPGWSAKMRSPELQASH
ncbi:tetratricopeptide repeat protein [Rufibacter quisquiliarum]|uniref:histidine kinase n=1 Tax=Rufibacter quisquiliarum TaxID=1549639 RepID=A0A839GWV1_9BACT|nr:tetratricopeptide repeat protein [Rufibacter quisquiliarum]MBA9079226.1 signal transduction histidine kinase [Rufibacter quisquiliarum]